VGGGAAAMQRYETERRRTLFRSTFGDWLGRGDYFRLCDLGISRPVAFGIRSLVETAV
jgi:hypothetical protein